MRHPLYKTLATLVVLASLLALPAAAADPYGRAYSLHTLDYRVAETLVWEICERMGGKSESCMVQHANSRVLTIFGTQELHASVAAMLTERDQRVPSSLLFEIVLVRLVDDGSATAPPQRLADRHQRALGAVQEIFPSAQVEILDTGLLQTTQEAQTRLGTDGGESYEVRLKVRSVVGGEEGLQLTVGLDLFALRTQGAAKVLATNLSLTEGETVVAGSSRTRGESPMVVLLTSKVGA